MLDVRSWVWPNIEQFLLGIMYEVPFLGKVLGQAGSVLNVWLQKNRTFYI